MIVINILSHLWHNQDGFLGQLIGGGIGLLGGLFGGGPAKEQGKLIKEIRKRYLPEYLAGTREAAGGLRGLQPFYEQYMQEGSPLLAARQRAAYENVAQQYQRAAGLTQQQIARAGYGYAPSGLFAGAMGDISRGAAKSASDAYLTNLLENEKFRFQAAQGKFNISSRLGQMFDPGVWASFMGGGGQGRDWATAARGAGDIIGGLQGIFGKAPSMPPMTGYTPSSPFWDLAPGTPGRQG